MHRALNVLKIIYVYYADSAVDALSLDAVWGSAPPCSKYVRSAAELKGLFGKNKAPIDSKDRLAVSG